VGKVARRMIGNPTPIAVLPMGTANNIANTLGIAEVTMPNLIKGWKRSRCVNVDAGVAKGPWGSQYFVEGFGIGLFAEAMHRLENGKSKELPDSGKPEQIMNGVLALLKKQLKGGRSVKMTVRLDGKDVSGDYVLLEALNICFIGPNLYLVPHADISDGFLDVVFVKRRERAKLSRYLTERLKRKKSRSKLTTRKGRHLQIEWESSPIHLDDKRWPREKDRLPVRSNAIDIKIHPGALVFLIPKARRQARTPS
jgi:diacylglycerol kinase (ATP)